jgi:hypothetical protein
MGKGAGERGASKSLILSINEGGRDCYLPAICLQFACNLQAFDNGQD